MNHHARLLVGPSAATKLRIAELLTADTEPLQLSFETLAIGDVRQLIMMAFQAPATPYTTRTICVTVHKIASEAGEALLKILEEPPQTTRFIFALPTVESLPMTVLSRFLVETVMIDEVYPTAFVHFIRSDIATRMEHIAVIAKQKDDSDWPHLATGLRLYMSRERQALPLFAEKVVVECMRYLQLRGASKKMIWEELALTLPVANLDEQ